jgi:hypothetical protein
MEKEMLLGTLRLIDGWYMAMISKRKRMKASIMMFSTILKEANTLDSKQIIFEAKRTLSIEQNLFSKRSDHVRQ